MPWTHINNETIKEQVRRIKRTDPYRQWVDYGRLWSIITRSTAPLGRFYVQDLFSALHSYAPYETAAEVGRLAGLMTRLCWERPYAVQQRKAWQRPARPRQPALAARYLSKVLERVSGVGYLLPEGFFRMCVNAKATQDTAFIEWLLRGAENVEVDWDMGYVTCDTTSRSYYCAWVLARAIVSHQSLMVHGWFPRTRYDCRQHRNRERLASGYRLACALHPTGALTDDQGGIFECKLIRFRGRGHAARPEVHDGVAVRYVVGDEVSWGAARRVDAAAKIARSHLGEQLQSVATQPAAGVSLSGGFL